MNEINLQIERIKGDLQSNSNLKNYNIVFGHRSVGNNIMNGITKLNDEILGLNLNIVTNEGFASNDTGIIFHYLNGQNNYPFTKVDSFYAFVEQNHSKIDIAFFKFCYADMIYSTDVTEIFNYYQSKMDTISDKYPDIQFIHFTVPLNVKPKGIKGAVKSIIKWDSNLKREDYNDLIRNTYSSNNLFDLAKYESHYDDNLIEKSITGISALRPDLTSDGGHLNSIGERYIGAMLMEKISEIAKNKEPRSAVN